MAKPDGFNITNLAQRTSASRKAIYKKIERARKECVGFIYIKGSGYWSFAKPGKEWICYLVQSEWSDDKVESEIRSNIGELFGVLDGKVCDVCTDILDDIKNAVMQG